MKISRIIGMYYSSAAIAESVITGIGLGAGLYCASRTKQTTAMSKCKEVIIIAKRKIADFDVTPKS